MSSSSSMASSRVFILVAIALVATAAGQVCEGEVECDYSPIINGEVHYFDFLPLCRNGGGDYHLTDLTGHDYYANICGRAATTCLPKGWLNTFEYGVAIQMWGDKPACDPGNEADRTCIEKAGGLHVCCSRDCQVLGVGDAHFDLIDETDADGGVKLTFTGAQPAADDPFWCPYDPTTGEQLQRQVVYVMQCNREVAGAIPLVAVENSTRSCQYTLTFDTPYACSRNVPYPSLVPPPLPSIIPRPHHSGSGSGLSGGWVFIIIVFVALTAYLVLGVLYTYQTERIWAFPNRQFWSNFGQYTSDGFSYVTSCGRSSGGGGASGASPYDEIGGTTTGSAYQTGSSGYNAGDEPARASTAYTDL